MLSRVGLSLCGVVVSSLLFSDCKATLTISPAPNAAQDLPSIAAEVAHHLQDRTVLSADKVPSVKINGRVAYRFVLRRIWKDQDPADIPQQVRQPFAQPPRFTVRNDDWEFILVPIQPTTPQVDLKSSIEWAKTSSRYHTRAVCLGEGRGFTWYSKHTIFNLFHIREKLKLSGGDDPIAMLADGLLIEDDGTMTANSVTFQLARYEDDALPHITSAIKRAHDPTKPIHALSHIPTPQSTRLLLNLFDSEDERYSRAATYALVSRPPTSSGKPATFRPEAKRAYLQMLRRGDYIRAATEACCQFKWTEAIPILDERQKMASSYYELRNIVYGRRKLAGHAISKDFADAEMRLRIRPQPGDAIDVADYQAARDLLVGSADTEAANISALSLALATAKGGADSLRAKGLSILEARPRAEVLRFLSDVAQHSTGQLQIQTKELLTQLSSQ